jgi:hypothetical protein
MSSASFPMETMVWPVAGPTHFQEVNDLEGKADHPLPVTAEFNNSWSNIHISLSLHDAVFKTSNLIEIQRIILETKHVDKHDLINKAGGHQKNQTKRQIKRFDII